MEQTLHLVCNAHLDPVWLWEWEEGLAETLSTFRAAVQFCEEFEEFIFSHNEALLYKWVETHEPNLLKKIQGLVKKGKWHIMGGWVLQPDCNMPSGESLIRQILLGKKYFFQKFGVEPKTAINFDPFGHTRGLVQILKKSGYTSYLFCRPDAESLKLPADDFVWVGYDNSQILTHRAGLHYNSERGKAREKTEKWITENPDRETGLLLWGIGNHGGGASREDLEQLRTLMSEKIGWRIQHGTPEAYFKTLALKANRLHRHTGDLNPWAVGCYTSMIRVKQQHRLLENTYYSTEKMLTHAAMQGLMEYPQNELREALEDLLFCEFHDILPGSSIQEVEKNALQKINHGLEILSRLRAKAFFSLLSGEPQAGDGEYPLLIYNPHPFPITETIVFEFQPPEPNFNPHVFWIPELRDHRGKTIPSQLEKESSNILTDYRKRVVFRTELRPGQMTRFSCLIKEVRTKPGVTPRQEGPLVFETDSSKIIINPETGLIDQYQIEGVDLLDRDALRLLVMEDDPDPWGMKVRGFRNLRGDFTLMTERECAEFAGVSRSELKPVRIIEEGDVRTVVETLFKYNDSSVCQRYMILKNRKEIEVEIRVYWNEKDTMLKLSIPTRFHDGQCRGQVAYGVENFNRKGEELVAQKWIGVVSEDRKYGLTIINNGTYGFDFAGGELRLSLLRSPSYSGHPVDGETTIVPQDRFEPRIDQGERLFRFWINGGKVSGCFDGIDREALVKNESPMALVCYPSGHGEKPLPNVSLDDGVIQMTALKKAEENDWLIIRLFNPTQKARQTVVTIPFLNLNFPVRFQQFEIKTMAVDLSAKDIFEVDLMERKLA